MRNDHPLKRNFYNTAVADILRAIDGGSQVGAFVLNFCLIDYANWIEFGSQPEGYKRWLEKYIMPISFNYQGKAEELYSVRNGLVHSYGPSKKIIAKEFAGYSLHKENVGMHMQRLNSPVLNICLYSILTDTIYGLHSMFESLDEKDIEKMDRLDKQITIQGVTPPTKYSQMHRALHPFDSLEVIALNHIRAAYTECILYSS